ncbi:MAG: DUF1934 domain-containing protein [Monoglobales bacterium]
MKKEANILLETESIPKNEPPRHISTSAKGTVFYKGGLLYILYKENPDEFGKTQTTIKIKGDRLELIRTGSINSRLVFCTESPYEGSYDTPYGSLPLKIKVESLEIDADETSGSIFMRYKLDLAGDKTDNNFSLKYKSGS